MSGLITRTSFSKALETRWLDYGALFLVVVGARLWLISLYGSPVPFWDQWDAEGAMLFKPWIEGTLRIGDLFQPHNEHRIVLSRLLALGLLWFNGQWDAQLQMVVNALFCGAMAVLITLALVQLFGVGRRPLIMLVIGLWSTLPFGHENTLWAFESAFYFLLFFSLLAIWGLASHPLFSWRWWAGVTGLLLACLSMASGVFAAFVLLGLGTLKLIKKRGTTRENLILMALCCAIIAIALFYRTTVPGHAAISANSFTVWANFFASCLAWPFCATSPASLMMYLPTGLLLARYLSKGPVGIGETWTRQTEIVIGVGAWVVFQAAAMAYFRGGGTVPPPPSRYMDILALGAVANFFALLLLLKELPHRLRGRQAVVVLATCWTIGLGAGSILISQRELAARRLRPQGLAPIEETVRAYVATGDRKYLEGPERTIPYPIASRLAMLLADPTIRNILPAVVRVPLRIEKASETGGAFVPDGYATPIQNPSQERGWGSYSTQGVAARGSMQSQSITTALPYLQFEIAGYMREGLSLDVQNERTGKKARVIPTKRADEYWRLAYIAVPGRSIRLLANDDSPSEWFGFREPRELARFSYYADILTRHGKSIFCGGVMLWLGLLLLRRQTWLE